MYLPPLQPVSNSKIRVCGDVTIHPTASIAPGVIIQAAPESSIVIEAEVCIGMGSIINAYQGSIKLERGAILGPGVLIIGSGTIGANTCIGSATTILNASLSPMTVVVSGSLIGDESRQLTIEPSIKNDNNNGATANNTSSFSNSSILEEKTTKESEESFQANHTIEQPEKTENSVLNSKTTTLQNNSHQTENIDEEVNSKSTQQKLSKNSKTENNDLESEPAKNHVAGKIYFNELLLTLFPHNKNSYKKE